MKAFITPKAWLVPFCMLLQLTCALNALAQKDTVIMKQGDRMIGTLVSLSHEVLTLKTPYSAGLPLNWGNVVYMVSDSRFKVLDKHGNLYIGKVKLDTAGNKKLTIITETDTVQLTRGAIGNISYYANSKLTDRFKMHVDGAYTQLKASKARTLGIGFGMAYEAKRWELALDYFSYASIVDTIHNSKGNIGISIKYLLPSNWFMVGQIYLFSSTEQRVDHRYNYFLGSGNSFFRDNNGSLSFALGGTYNDEKFTGSPSAFKSGEVFGDLDFEYFVLKDINITAEALAFPSVTESGRFRSAVKADVNYNFLGHFTTGVGFMLNTDSKPPVTSSKSDYIVNVKIGWKL